jgi:signal transduction histidine kinase
LVTLTGKLRDLDRLANEFDDRLEQEKLASLGELAYGASHEINNPLANISTRAQALMTDESDPERRRMLAIINSQALRANEMIADMMLFARPPQLVCEPIDLVTLVNSLLDELAPDAALQGTRLNRVGLDEPGLTVSADATQLAMALRAVIVNALQALGADGEVEVQLLATAPPSPGAAAQAKIAVRDTGPGIPPDIRRHLFDPFFSGREAGRGLGLGLAKCWRVVTLHGGRIEVASPPHQGTIITLSLPLAVGEASEAAEIDQADRTATPDA